MGYELNMRVWRGDASGGHLGSYAVEVMHMDGWRIDKLLFKPTARGKRRG